MSYTVYDHSDSQNCVKFTNDEWSHLGLRGVMMPAGIFGVRYVGHPTNDADRFVSMDEDKRRAGIVDRVYVSDRADKNADGTMVTATAAEARACGMAMRAYADAVRYGIEGRRGWVEALDRVLLSKADDVVEFFATCNGFATR